VKICPGNITIITSIILRINYAVAGYQAYLGSVILLRTATWCPWGENYITPAIAFQVYGEAATTIAEIVCMCNNAAVHNEARESNEYSGIGY
jgi:hypothetical protein